MTLKNGNFLNPFNKNGTKLKVALIALLALCLVFSLCWTTALCTVDELETGAAVCSALDKAGITAKELEKTLDVMLAFDNGTPEPDSVFDLMQILSSHDSEKIAKTVYAANDPKSVAKSPFSVLKYLSAAKKLKDYEFTNNAPDIKLPVEQYEQSIKQLCLVASGISMTNKRDFREVWKTAEDALSSPAPLEEISIKRFYLLYDYFLTVTAEVDWSRFFILDALVCENFTDSFGEYINDLCSFLRKIGFDGLTEIAEYLPDVCAFAVKLTDKIFVEGNIPVDTTADFLSKILSLIDAKLPFTPEQFNSAVNTLKSYSPDNLTPEARTEIKNILHIPN